MRRKPIENVLTAPSSTLFHCTNCTKFLTQIKLEPKKNLVQEKPWQTGVS